MFNTEEINPKSTFNIKSFKLESFQANYYNQFVCMFVCWHVLGQNFGAKTLIFFPLTLSLLRIEKYQISTKLVAFSHNYDHFSYFDTSELLCLECFCSICCSGTLYLSVKWYIFWSSAELAKKENVPQNFSKEITKN